MELEWNRSWAPVKKKKTGSDASQGPSGLCLQYSSVLVKAWKTRQNKLKYMGSFRTFQIVGLTLRSSHANKTTQNLVVFKNPNWRCFHWINRKINWTAKTKSSILQWANPRQEWSWTAWRTSFCWEEAGSDIGRSDRKGGLEACGVLLCHRLPATMVKDCTFCASKSGVRGQRLSGSRRRREHG